MCGLPRLKEGNVQEELSGKSYKMLMSTYDEVTISDMRDEGRGLGIPSSAEESA